MKVLIIGSKGFIGSYLHSYLIKNYDVWGCDVVVDYTSKKYYLIDSSTSEFTDVFQNNNYDVCINCSGASSVPDSFNNPQRDFILNTTNVFKILESIRKYNNFCKFINLSSAAVYGNPSELPVTEKSETNPLSPYGIHKRQAEIICKEFYDFYNIKTCSLRIFSVYGPGLKKQLLWDLYQKSLKNKDEVTLFGTGKESRDFIYIDDLVHAIELIMIKAKYTGECINIANGDEILIERIAELFYSSLHWNGRIKFDGKNRNGDPNNWKADIQYLKQIEYQPSYDLEKGIKEYIKWIKELK